jgi:hypothetical protein
MPGTLIRHVRVKADHDDYGMIGHPFDAVSQVAARIDEIDDFRSEGPLPR